jgi:NADPH:quinone reductase-like Zn-dependent oxidoreductase
MKAVTFKQTSGIDAIEVTDRPSPTPGADEVLIRVHAATINPVDLSAVTGKLGPRMPGAAPWIAGWDLAGTVTAVGSGVDSSLVGMAVLGFSQWFNTGTGTQASEVVLPFENVAVASGSLSPTELTTFGLNGLTALHALNAAEVPDGGTVLVVGASGGVGGFVAELAAEHGLTVIPVGRATDRAELASANADALVNSGPIDPSVLVGVRDGGRVISVTGEFESVRGIQSKRVGVQPDKAGLETIVRLAESGVLTSKVGQTFPVEQAADAYRAFAENDSHDRVVITF